VLVLLSTRFPFQSNKCHSSVTSEGR
jgi:hypothetical protein